MRHAFYCANDKRELISNTVPLYTKNDFLYLLIILMIYLPLMHYSPGLMGIYLQLLFLVMAHHPDHHGDCRFHHQLSVLTLHVSDGPCWAPMEQSLLPQCHLHCTWLILPTGKERMKPVWLIVLCFEFQQKSLQRVKGRSIINIINRYIR